MEDKAGNLKRRPRGNGNDTTLFSRWKVRRLVAFLEVSELKSTEAKGKKKFVFTRGKLTEGGTVAKASKVRRKKSRSLDGMMPIIFKSYLSYLA